jgi:opacity protein-like surface antigen
VRGDSIHKRLLRATLALAIAASASAASAEKDALEFLVGGDSAVTIFEGAEHPPGARVDDVDFSWSFYGGVRYKWLGASAGYVDFGELHVHAPGLRERVEYRGATISAHAFLPISEQLTLSGELGVLVWQQAIDFQDSIGAFNADEDGASLLLGLGGGYRITPTSPLSVTLRYNRFFDVGDQRRVGNDNDIDRVGVGLVFAF